MNKFWSICKNTFVQTVRQPIFSVLIAATFVMIVLTLPLTGLTVGKESSHSDQRMFENLGVSTLLISGLLVAAFSASSVLSREIEDKTALTVISKPVSRATFVFGKFAGVTAAVILAYYLCTLVFLMCARNQIHTAAGDPMDWPVIVLGCSALALAIFTALAGNYFFGWSFTSAVVWSTCIFGTIAMGIVVFVGKGWTIVQPGYDSPGANERVLHLQLLIGVFQTMMSVVILSAIAIAASTRFSQVVTLLICLGALCVGFVHPWLFERWANEAPMLRVLGWAVPNLRLFDPQDRLTMSKPIPASYLLQLIGYCVIYVGAILAVAVASFQQRELYGQTTSYMPGPVGLVAWAGRVVAAIMAGTAAVILSMLRFRTADGFTTAGVLVVLAILTWLIFGYFGRGKKWGYFVVFIMAVLGLIRSMGGLTVSTAEEYLFTTEGRVLLICEAAVAAIVIVILVLPRTRRHFNPIGQ